MSWLNKINSIIRQTFRMEASDEDEVTVFNSRGKPVITVSPHRIIYVRAAENYSVFHIAGKDGQVEEICVRCTLSHAEEAFAPYLHRCHRSYLYNPEHLIHFIDIREESRLQLYTPAMVEIPVTITHRNRILKVIELLMEEE